MIMKNEKNSKKEERFAVSAKGQVMILVGFLVMVAGLVLLAGGGVQDREVFNYAMFDFRRLVLAPVVLVAGIGVVVAGIMKKEK